MANIIETALFPISSKEEDYMRMKLSEGRVIDKGYFTPYGTFRVLEEVFWGHWNIADHMWSPALLGSDPTELKLATNRAGNLVVINNTGGVVKAINTSEIREVYLRNRKRQIVGESGYLLPPPAQLEFIGNHVLDPTSLEKLLVLAEKGIRSRDNIVDTRYFAVKVNPALVGRKLLRLDFRFLYPDPQWVKDGVVIDPQTNQLVPREIYHPFARHRWERR